MSHAATAWQPDALPHWDEHFAAMALSGVRPDFTARTIDDDRAQRGAVTPNRGRQQRAAREARGLVSVPTTGTPVVRVPTEVERAALATELQAFKVDADARRLSQLRMHVGFAARAHAVSAKGHRSDVPWMVTLTYADPDGWRPDHIKTAIQAVRKWAQRQGFACRYVWVAENQEKRAQDVGHAVIHYHLCIWLPRGVRMPKWDVRGWWKHGMSNRKVARHAVAYLMKYLSKGTTYGALPSGARTYGVGGLDHSLRRARAWLRLPAFVQGNASIHHAWKRAKGGGWIDDDGVVWPSEFASVVVGGVRMLSRVLTHARAIVAGGPFSWLSDRGVACGA